MGWMITGAVSGVDAEVDATFRALRVSLRPAQAVAYNGYGMVSGAITAIAAGGAITSFRNLSANLIVVRRVSMGCLLTTGFTAAQILDFGLFVARAFTVSDSGGTVVALTGNEGKFRTSLASFTNADMRIATTAALTAGTKVLDTVSLVASQTYCAAAAAGNVLPESDMFNQQTGDYPLILAQNEGMNIRVLTTMGAAGVGRFHSDVEMAEVISY